MSEDDRQPNRRSVMKTAGACAAGLGLAGVAVALGRRAGDDRFVWQLDPAKCVQCGRCATDCVLSPSAVKCVHAYDICGYCDLCAGYHEPGEEGVDAGGENELCPESAIRRTLVEDPYYEYSVVEDMCVGCGKCVKGCSAFGNGSLYLQIRHDRCLNCNECRIAINCPAGAFRRVPVTDPYILKGKQGEDRAERKKKDVG